MFTVKTSKDGSSAVRDVHGTSWKQDVKVGILQKELNNSQLQKHFFKDLLIHLYN